MEVLIYSIIIFIIGLCFGSFFNVVGYRLPNNMSIAFPSSHCPNCNHKLGKLELIPVLSYLFQKGKCKNCKQQISIFYPIFELLTGILFVLCYLSFKDVYPEIINIIFACLFTSSMIIIMISDIKYMIIPDEVLIFFSIVLVILKLYITYKLGIINNLLDLGYEFIFILKDGFVMFLIMYLIRLFGNFVFKKDSMGGGDIKMMIYVSFILGWKLSIVVIFIASFLALPISIFNMYKKNEHMLPFGPYLAISSLILLLGKIDLNTIINLLY
ncbi:MAG: prepilin peptidase [Bacilli bacterium]|nr:prepilin peptidase [Bacilli bacterium]